MKRKKILVTGAAGLIGSHLCDELLKQDYNVVGVDNLSYGKLDNLENCLANNNFIFVRENVEDLLSKRPTLINKFNFDIIFHLASYKKYHNSSDTDMLTATMMRANIRATEIIADIALHNNAYLFFTSTSDVYGNSNSFLESDNIGCSTPYIARNYYSVTKTFEEHYLMNEYRDSGLKLTILRLFGCFSERSNRSWSGGHIPLFIDKALKNENIIIHGDGLQTRSMCDARDIVKVMKLFNDYVQYNIECINGEIFNVGTDQQTTVIDIAKYIINKTNSKSILVFNWDTLGSYKEIKKRWANLKKIKELLRSDNIKMSDTFETIDRVIEEWLTKTK